MKKRFLMVAGILTVLAFMALNVNIAFKTHDSNIFLSTFNKALADGEGQEGYQQVTKSCYMHPGDPLNGCKYECPSGPDPSCELHICQYWYYCMR